MSYPQKPPVSLLVPVGGSIPLELCLATQGNQQKMKEKEKKMKGNEANLKEINRKCKEINGKGKVTSRKCKEIHRRLKNIDQK